MVTLVARSVLVNTMAALCANLALLTGAKAEPNNYGRGGGGQGEARAGPRRGSLLQRNYLQQAEPHLRLMVQRGLLHG